MHFFVRLLITLIVWNFFVIAAKGQCSLPTTTDNSGCAGPSSLSARTTGSTVTSHKWYTSSSGTGTITPTSNFSPTSGVWVSTFQSDFSSNVTYYVASVCNGIESARKSVSFLLTIATPLYISPSSNPTNVCAGSNFNLRANGGSNYSWYLGDPDAGGTSVSSNPPANDIIYPTQSGQYYLKGFNSCGVWEKKLIPVTFYPKPAAPSISNATVGYNVLTLIELFNPTEGDTYLWYNSASPTSSIWQGTRLPVNLTQNASYLVSRVTNCESNKTPFQVSVNAYPSVNAGIDKTIILPTNSVNLSGSASDPEGSTLIYRWEKVSGPVAATLSGNTTPTLALSGLAAGIYIFRLTVTDSFGQLVVDDAFVTVKDPNGALNNYNYLKQESIQIRGIKDISQTPALPINQKATSITYLNDLGSPMESIAMKASPAQRDVIVPVVTDELGRNAKIYLPVVPPVAGNGSYREVLDANGEYSGDVSSFYTDKPYSVTKFDNTPMSRVVEQGSFGQAWQPGSTSGTTKANYGSNVAGEIWFWTISTGGLPQSISTWSANVLNVTTSSRYVSDVNTIPEINQVVSSAEGLTILSRTKLDASSWSETYQVYDQYNNLRFVLPPALMKILRDAGNFIPTSDQIDRWCFQNMYDNLGRVIASKGPGTDWEYFVYDNLDRLILNQNGNQRDINQWSFTKYDEFNRSVISGIYKPTTVFFRDDLQTIVNGQNGGKGFQNSKPPTNTSASIRTGANIVSSAYDNYKQYQATNSISLRPGFSFAATSENTFRAAIGDGGTISDGVFPSDNIDNLVITYYDNYLGNNDLFQDPSFGFVSETVPSGADAFLKWEKVKGNVTGSSIRILGSGSWLHTIVYYDKKQRIIQTATSNHTGGVNRLSTCYDFSGRVLQSKSSGPPDKNPMITRRYSYDHSGRLLKTYHKLNQQNEVILSADEFNELDQLVDHKIHSEDIINGSTYLQSVDYAYNIKGWLTKANSASASDAGEIDYFGYEMGYETDAFGANGSNTTRKDGLFTSLKWRNDFATKQNIYTYDYDNLKRLTNANFKAGTNSAWTSDLDFFSEKGIGYDYNGNIQTLERNKQTGLGLYQTIDNLSYTYGTAKGNQLMKVTENSAALLNDMGFQDGNVGSDDYAYDKNGNLTLDKNKSIKEIKYNVLDLPEKVTFNDDAYMQYVYDAAGTKLNQTLFNATNQPQLKTDYVGEQVLVNDVLVVIFHEEGRILPPDFTNLIENREANGLSGFTASGTVALTSEYLNSQTYVKAVCNQASGSPGIFPIGATYAVKANESYTFKVLGYQSIGTAAKLYVWTNLGVLPISVVALPQGSSNETWSTVNFVIPTGANQLKVGVLWSTASVGNTMNINRVALYKTDWEYQYFLNDQVGSPRVVLSTNPSTLKYNATFETENQATESGTNGHNGLFFNVKPTKIVPHPSNVTPGGNEVIVLDNTYRIGPSRSIKVYPGDRIDASTSVFYNSMNGLTQATNAVLSNALSTVMTAADVVGFDGGITTAYNISSGTGGIFSLSPDLGTSKPSAFLNLIYFDKNYVPLTAVSAPVSGANVAHPISISFPFITEVGYVFLYLSYDNENGGPVYFDDFKITHTESPMVQANDYYPYGLTSYSWTREGEYENRFLYQGKELDQKTGWHDFHARQYDASLGRWFAVDPKGHSMPDISPFAAMGNNPVMMIDPNGEEPVTAAIIIGAIIGAYTGGTIANDGQMNPVEWDYNSGKTWGYMAAGAVVGGVSGGAGSAVSTSGIPFANTAGIVVGSTINSVGTYAYTGGQTDVSISFGAGSYNFTQNEWGYLGKKGNSVLGNVGYGLGALANLQDAYAGLDGAIAYVKSRKEIGGHSWIEGEDVNISVGPAVDNKPELEGVKWETQYLFKTVKGTNFTTRVNPNQPPFITKLNNVNIKKLQLMTKNLNKGLSLSGKHSLRYGVWNGCVNQTARALSRAGVLNLNTLLPITSPVLLNAELALRNYGMMFSHYMTTY